MRTQAYTAGLVVCMAWLLAGCTNVVTLPAEVTDPVTVYLVDHGRHATIFMAREMAREETAVEGQAGAQAWTEWSYGEWAWLACGQRGCVEGFTALCWPTPATLGRRDCAAPTLGEANFALQVERERARELASHLNELFDGGLESVHNAAEDMDFVRLNQVYWAGHQCNQVMAGWLRRLGCEVEGMACLSNWEVRSAATAGAARADTEAHGRK